MFFRVAGRARGSAPASRYAAFVDTAVRIVSSFRPIVPHRSKSGAPAPSPAIEFVSWRDPAEGAFQVQVPRGWRVDGGLRRRSALDYQRGVNLVSPDGRVVVLLMDRDIPFFTLPDSTTALPGLPEGSWYAAPDGSRMPIRRYVPGSEFAQQYAVNRFSRTFRDLRVERKLDRPDLAAAVRERHAALDRAAAGFMRYSAAAGEVHLTGTRDGAHRGYVASTTVLAQSAVAGAWEVGELHGFFAPSDRVNEAVIVLQRLTWRASGNSSEFGEAIRRRGARRREAERAHDGPNGCAAQRTIGYTRSGAGLAQLVEQPPCKR